MRTEDGHLFTTNKLFPAIDGSRVKFEYPGSPVDLEAPAVRMKEKGRARKLEVQGSINDPRHPADILARKLYEGDQWEPKHIASLALCISRTLQANDRHVQQGAHPGPKCNFLAGGFTFSGMSGVRSDTVDHPWVTRYLCAYLSRHTSLPFAGVGLALNVDHTLHRDVHNHRGVRNVVLPIVSSGGGLWVQSKSGRLDTAEPESSTQVRTLANGKQVHGCTHSYVSHQTLDFEPHLWHESVVPQGPQLLLFGYTARGLHSLDVSDRRVLWDAGFTFVPGSKAEYWARNVQLGTITRHHPFPRRAMFAPSVNDLLPFDRGLLGDLRLCVQQFPSQQSVQTFQNWRRGRGRAAKLAWTGQSIFQLRSSAPSGNGGRICRSCRCTRVFRFRILGFQVNARAPRVS